MSGHPLFFLSSCAFYWDSRVSAWVGETSIRRGAGCPRAIASQGTTLSEARQALDRAVDLAIKHWTVEPAWPISPPPTKAQRFKWEPEPPPAKAHPNICGPYKGKGSLQKGCRHHPGNDLGEDGYCAKGRTADKDAPRDTPQEALSLFDELHRLFDNHTCVTQVDLNEKEREILDSLLRRRATLGGDS